MRSVTMFLLESSWDRDFSCLSQLIHILQARGSDVSGGGQHDAVKELNMGLQLV